MIRFAIPMRTVEISRSSVCHVFFGRILIGRLVSGDVERCGSASGCVGLKEVWGLQQL